MKASAVVLFGALSSVVWAQQSPIQTDRPDQTETAAIVPLGYFQAEHGFQYEESETGSLVAHPSTLLKLGWTESFEFRAVVEAVSLAERGLSTVSGVQPLEVGFKVALWNANDESKALSFIGHLQLPTVATSHFRAKNKLPLMRFAAHADVAEDWRVSSNLGMEWDALDGSPTSIYTLALGSSFSEQVGWFTELFGFVPLGDADADHSIDGGLTYQPNDDFQIDLSGGLSLTSKGTTWFSAVGISYRVSVFQ